MSEPSESPNQRRSPSHEALLREEDDEPERVELRAGMLPFAGVCIVMVLVLGVVVVRGGLFDTLPVLVGALITVVLCARLVERALHASMPLAEFYASEQEDSP